MKKQRKDIYQVITNQVIEGLQKVGLDWFKSWSSKDAIAINHVSGKLYKGINQLFLGFKTMDMGYSSGEFMTYKQAQNLGGQVRKGEKSTTIIFWNISYYTIDSKGEKTYYKRREDVPNGLKVNKSMFPRAYSVFNVDQIEGIEPKHEKSKVVEGTIFEPIKKADNIYKKMRKSPSLYHMGSSAFYNPQAHAVTMPKKESFISSDDYYKVLFHELVHSTGHKDILNRGLVGVTKNKIKYSKEELVAELGAMFLVGVLDLNPKDNEKNSQAYINGWISYLKNNPKEIISASSQATKAVEYMLNKK